MDNAKMTRWGIGSKFAIISGIYAFIILILEYICFFDLSIPLPHKLSLFLGIILIIIGFSIFLIPAFTIGKYFNNGQLIKKGIYKYFRHPIYASWIVFFVPGIVLIKNSVLELTIPLFMYFVFRILIIKEEKYLLKKFGKEYLKYKKTTGAIFPKLF